VRASRDSKMGRRSRVSAFVSGVRRRVRGRRAEMAGIALLKTWWGFTDMRIRASACAARWMVASAELEAEAGPVGVWRRSIV